MVESQNEKNAQTMIFYVNGIENHGAPLILQDVLARYGIASTALGIAIAVNETVIPRDSWGSYSIEPQDRIEIVRAFQGG